MRDPRTVMLLGDAAVEIAQACDGVVDVLFAGSRGYGPVHRTFAGSAPQALMLTSTQPVVVLPRADAPVAPGLSARLFREPAAAGRRRP